MSTVEQQIKHKLNGDWRVKSLGVTGMEYNNRQSCNPWKSGVVVVVLVT